MGFIKYHCKVLSIAFGGAWAIANGASFVLSILIGVIIWKYPAKESIMNPLVWIIPLIIFVAFLIINIALIAPYRIYKKQEGKIEELQEEIEKLQGNKLFKEFEQNVKTLAGILDDGIKKMDKWFEDFKGVNERNRLYFLKRTSDDVISIVKSFYPFGDLFPEIQRFLIHHIPNFKGEVDKVYSNIGSKSEEIVGKCGYAPLNPPANPVIPWGEMRELKNSIEELGKNLRYCVEIAKEEKE
jgi:hypothetical protein